MRRLVRMLLIALALFPWAWPVRAGFPSLESFLPAVGRVSGAGGAEFYTTIWATNLTSAPVSFTFDFLKQGQANTTPASFSDDLAPGETKVYENVVQSKLGLSDALGGARVVSTGEILVAERIYNQAPGADLGDTEGLFFAGVPKSFSISLGQSASIQGINQGGAEDFRYNFALLETGGGSPTVNVQLFDGNGTMLGQKAYALQPYEQLQPNVKDLFAGIATTNARITATVTAGTGSVLIAGAQLANTSQDSSGFEMSFRDELLGGGGGTAGVTSLNGLTGALTIAHGANTTVNVNGHTITIDAVSGSGTGLTAVAHDNTLIGSGTVAVPLGIANGQVVRSLNGFHDAVTLAGSSSVTITPSGNTLTFTATGGGGGGGLTLPFSGSVGSAIGFAVSNSGTGEAIDGSSSSSAEGVHGASQSGYGVRGTSVSSIGVYGQSAAGGSNTAVAVYGANSNSGGAGVGGANTGNGNAGYLGGPSYGVAGTNTHGGQGAVYGTNSSSSGYGVQGNNSTSGNNGYLGGIDYGVFGTSAGDPGVVGKTSANNTGAVWGHNNSSGNDGYLGGPDYGAFGISTSSSGVIGESTSGTGVYGSGGLIGVQGVGSNGVRGDSGGVFGILGCGNPPVAGGPYAGCFHGNVEINGGVHTSGVGAVTFDDPADPANATITHAFVGSSEMKNMYDGVATLGPTGVVTVELPEWFETLNKDFRYQLTALGTPQAGLFVSKEIANNQFTIAGGVPGARVSWQVTGVRRDPWAASHPIVARQEKPAGEKGFYIDPELYGQPETKSADAIVRPPPPPPASTEGAGER